MDNDPLKAMREEIDANSKRMDAELKGSLAPDGEENPGWSEHSNAMAFAEDAHGMARYVDTAKKWYIWNGVIWEEDRTLRHFDIVRYFMVQRSDQLKQLFAAGKLGDMEEAKVKGIINNMQSLRKMEAVLRIAKTDKRIASTMEAWNRDHWLLGTPEGTVDLKTGKLRPARYDDLITKSTAVAPRDMPTPVWDAFLKRIMRHAPEIIPYLYRVMGYSLTGSTEEQIAIFAYGQGQNGKGTFFNTISDILGDYSGVAPSDFLIKKNERHPTDIAGLAGARLVIASELEGGSKWDQQRFKQLTGGDRVAARLMGQNFFTFIPNWLLCIFANTKPSIQSVDKAMARRMRLIPFTQNIPDKERDQKLGEKLRAEWPGILYKLIQGCLDWQRIGLKDPDAVLAATQNYLEAEDILGQWIAENTVPGNGPTLSQWLYTDWSKWCDRAGIRPGSLKGFVGRLTDRGYEPGRLSSGKNKGRMGITGLLTKRAAWAEWSKEELAQAGGVPDADLGHDFPSGHKPNQW